MHDIDPDLDPETELNLADILRRTVDLPEEQLLRERAAVDSTRIKRQTGQKNFRKLRARLKCHFGKGWQDVRP